MSRPPTARTARTLAAVLLILAGLGLAGPATALAGPTAPSLPEDYMRRFCQVEPIVEAAQSGTAITCRDPGAEPRQFRAVTVCTSPKISKAYGFGQWVSTNGGRSEARCGLRPLFTIGFDTESRS